jgi:hypothetical protein
MHSGTASKLNPRINSTSPHPGAVCCPRRTYRRLYGLYRAKLDAATTTCRFTLQQARNDFQMSSSSEGAARVPGGAVGPRACCEPGAPPCALPLLEQTFETSGGRDELTHPT